MGKVKIYEETITIPTYEVGKPDKNPMFYEKRVYQGSSGKVYPLPVIDKIHDQKIDRQYNVVWIENKYLKVMIMPELGGRIQRAIDKTNNYDFVYYNQVIKPALVGLAGPWISGGIEFNWPQHHRPSTFSPVDFKLEEHEDGSCTCWTNEIDQMYGTKALTGFTLRPGKSYIEITGQLYNPTDIPQTFLWWANPAVAVNDYTKSIFPPDVHAVFDHGKRDVSEFPIAYGEYYKVDYSPGTDISRYKNIPVPTSYMAYHSDYNFVGGFDFREDAGILHVANHHISPGKKQWTWGNGDFGQAWDRNLTDEDGPYIELMTGVYTDNQPDFTWLEPGEEKAFKQYFMPYKTAGEVKNATIDVVINLELEENIKMVVYTTSLMNEIKVVLSNKDQIVYEEKISHIDPNKAKTFSVKLDNYTKSDIKMEVFDKEGNLLVDYKYPTDKELDIPDAAVESAHPTEIKSTEELFLTGLHLEQYRHATYLPDDYYLEGLSRDSGDVRLNNAYGLLLYRRGQYKECEKYFRKATERLLWKNPNPYDSEPLYNLGLSLKMQDKLDEAFKWFYKSIWNDAMQAKGYYQLATIASRKSNYEEAIDLVEKSLVKNGHNLKARNIRTTLHRKLGKKAQALELAKESIKLDILDYTARNELYLLQGDMVQLNELDRIMRGNENSYLELAIFYGDIGLYNEAVGLLKRIISPDTKPLIYYYLGYFSKLLGKDSNAKKYYTLANSLDSSYVFPNKLFTIKVLESAIKLTPNLSKAYYYLGNLYYDKLIADKAISLWETSRELDNTFPTVHRNLGLAYYNKQSDYIKARESFEKAYNLDKTDSRVFYELDQLYKRTNVDIQKRLEFIEDNLEVMKQRDDFFIEYLAILNNLGQYKEALDLVLNRQFHVWEGGEGRVVEQYVFSLKHLAHIEIKNNNYKKAINFLQQAKVYPINLGEGKLLNAQENDLDYYLGNCFEALNEEEKANMHYTLSTRGTDEPTAAMFYNDAKPDSIFYQGLSLLKLGKTEDAKARFTRMIDYGERHFDDNPQVDYFAVSLPSFLIFEEDLVRSNKVHCYYLQGLGYLGLKDKSTALDLFNKSLELNINHLGVQSIINFTKK